MPCIVLYAATRDTVLRAAQEILERHKEVDIAIPITQVAAEFGVTERTIALQQEAGVLVLPRLPEKMGRTIMYSVRAVNALLSRKGK